MKKIRPVVKSQLSRKKEGGTIMAEIKRSISINAPVEKVFAYIDDPVN